MADINELLMEAEQALFGSSSNIDAGNAIGEATGLTLTDPDTVRLGQPIKGEDGEYYQSIRIPGVDALEVEHYTGSGVVRGDYGGARLNDNVLKLINNNGFNKVVSSGEVDATGGRLLGDLQNDKGESLQQKLLYHNLVMPTEYSSADDVTAFIVGNVDRRKRLQNGLANEWDKASLELMEDRYAGSNRGEVKPLAMNEAEYAERPNAFSGVAFRQADRTINNKARSMIGTAFELGKLGVIEGAYGAIEMFGEMFDVDSMSRYGDAHQKRLKHEIESLPINDNQAAFDEKGKWRLNSIMDFTEFMLINAAQSAPYMANTIIATALAPVTGGASLVSPASVYAGMVYNEQPEDNKNEAAALFSGIAQAALDVLGVKIGGQAGAILTKTSMQKVAKQVASKRNIPLEEAEELTAKSFQTALRSLNRDTLKALESDIAINNAAKGIGKAAGIGMLGEGVTESAQELLAMAGEMKEVDQNEVRSRLLNAAVAGGVLGGAFGTAGAVIDYGSVKNSIGKHQKTADEGNRDVRFQDRERSKYKRVRSKDDIITEYEKKTLDLQDQSLAELGEEEYAQRQQKGLFRSAIGYARNAGVKGFFEGFKSNTLNKFIDIDELRDLGSILGANNINSGADDEVALQLRLGALNSMVPIEEQAQQDLKVNGTAAVSKIVYDPVVQRFVKVLLQKAGSIKGNLDLHQIALDNKLSLRTDNQYYNIQKPILDLASKLANLDRASGRKLGTTMDTKTIDRAALEKNFQGFKELLVTKYKVAPQQAQVMAEDIRDINSISTPEDAMDKSLNSFEGDFDTGPMLSIKELHKDPDFSEFFNNNIFYNMAALNSATAHKNINDKFFGSGGRKIAGMLKLAHKNGKVTKEQMHFLAAELNDYMEMKRGRYGRIENDFLRKTQQNIIFFTTLNQLPLATLSSLVELSLLPRLLTRDQVFKQIAPLAKTAGLEMANYINEMSSKAGLTQRKSYLKGGRERLASTGYLDQQQSAMQRAGVDDTSGRKSNLMNAFFKLIFLQGFTNISRSGRLSVFGDYLLERIQVLDEMDSNTIGYLEAKEELAAVNVNTDLLLEAYRSEGQVSPEISEAIENEILVGSVKFTEQAVAHPRVGNRPKFYNDPRLALLTSFQGFIASFTSTILPSIYKGIAGRTLGARAESIKTIALLIAFGFLAQYIRDIVKYGEAPDWLDDEEKFQRAVYASGLLGTGERIYDMFDPLYPQRSTGATESIGNFLEGEMPAISYMSRIGTTFNKALEGDLPGAARQGFKSLPVVGPLHQGAVAAEDYLDKALRGDL